MIMGEGMTIERTESIEICPQRDFWYGHDKTIEENFENIEAYLD